VLDGSVNSRCHRSKLVPWISESAIQSAVGRGTLCLIMVAPGFLQTPQVREWLNGIEPAWTLLEFDSFNALRRAPSRDERAIRLAANISGADLAASAVASNALRLLQRAGDSGGLKLTASGNVSRAVVTEMRDALEWPGYDKDEEFQFNRVINDPDFLPLHFVRVLCQGAGLMRRYRGSLRLTDVGKRMLTAGHGGLQAILFHITFWLTNLAHLNDFHWHRGRSRTWGSCCGPSRPRPLAGKHRNASCGCARCR
jgi:hypothetical protein